MKLIGNLTYNNFRVSLYWHEESKSEIEIIELGDSILVKGNKHYAIVETSDPEEFISRIGSLGTFYDYLKRTFPSLEMKILCLTELLPSFVHNENRNFKLSEIQEELKRYQFLQNLSELTLDDLHHRYNEIANNPLLSIPRASIREQIRQIDLAKKFSKSRIKELKEVLSEVIDRENDSSILTKAYLKHGVGTCFLITTSSQYYYVSKQGIHKVLKFVLQDLKDYDIIIKQRAKQGFHIMIRELDLPQILLTKNTILNPNNLLALSKVFPEIKPLYEKIRANFTVSIVEDIRLRNRKVRKKLSLLQAVASLLRRSVEHEEISNLVPQPEFEKIPSYSEKRRLAYVGLISGVDFKPSERLAFFDLDQQLPRMMMISGETGCGKTIAARVIVEGCLLHRVPCIVIDPTGQWTGFAKKCEDEKMLKLYREFGMKKEYARSFRTKVFNSKDSFDIEELLEPNISVFLTKGMEQSEMDEYTFQVVSRVYEYFSNQRESEKLRFVLVVEEAHKLAPREKHASHKAVNLLGNCTRELRKYGVGLIFITQMVKDFAAYLPGGLAIRGNTATKIQMRTGYEGDLNRIMQSYGSSYQKLIPKLPSGVGLIEFSDYGKPFFVCFRPTLSHPFSFEEKELENLGKGKKIEELVGKILEAKNTGEKELSQEERIFLETLRSFLPEKPSVSQLVKELKGKIRSLGKIYKTRDSLLKKGLIKVLEENGKKRICLENQFLDGKSSELKGRNRRS